MFKNSCFLFDSEICMLQSGDLCVARVGLYHWICLLPTEKKTNSHEVAAVWCLSHLCQVTVTDRRGHSAKKPWTPLHRLTYIVTQDWWDSSWQIPQTEHTTWGLLISWFCCKIGFARLTFIVPSASEQSHFLHKSKLDCHALDVNNEIFEPYPVSHIKRCHCKCLRFGHWELWCRRCAPPAVDDSDWELC